MGENESIYGTTLSQESIKVIAESIGVGNFPDEAAKELAEDVSYRLKEIIQVNNVLSIVLRYWNFYWDKINLRACYFRLGYFM